MGAGPRWERGEAGIAPAPLAVPTTSATSAISAGLALLAVLALPLSLGCAGAVVERDGRVSHRDHGWSVAAPSAQWQRAGLEGAALSYRTPSRALVVLQSRCDVPVAQPQILARHLMIGLGARTLRQSGPVGIGSLRGWSQTFDTDHDGRLVRVKTVTIVAGKCTFDWILSAETGFESVEADFDAWWQSFELDPEALPGTEVTG